MDKNKIFHAVLLGVSSFLAFKAQTDPRYAWATLMLQAFGQQMPSAFPDFLSSKKNS